MGRIFTALLAATTFFLLSACEEKGAPPPETDVKTYRGVLESAFEVQAFHPDTGEGPWWFSADSKIWDELDQRDETGNAKLQFYTAEIEFTGRFDDNGAGFGHMGAYPAEIRARELISKRYVDRFEAEALVTRYKENLKQGPGAE